MARKRLPPNNPREWLNRARSNLARAADPRDVADLEDLETWLGNQLLVELYRLEASKARLRMQR